MIHIQLAVAQRTIEKFAKKLLGESEVEAVLQRLDRLTQDEAHMTVAQTLSVVHGLVNNTKVVMEGAQSLALIVRQYSSEHCILLDGKAATDNIRQALCLYLT